LYTVTYNCDFDLIMFPFDRQDCLMKFTLVSATSSYMELVEKAARFTGKKDLIEYSIGEVKIELGEEEAFSTVYVTVRFTRRYGFYLLTLYIPTTLIMFN
ncbi:unnamed protein product, partial [Meganyctiphanes norvegica]